MALLNVEEPSSEYLLSGLHRGRLIYIVGQVKNGFDIGF
jgi:hypothetical protein